MIRRSSLPKKRRSGAVAVVVALCLIPLIGVTAFAIDGGLLIAARRRAQTVADAAAYASACRLYNNLSNSTDPTGLDVPGTAAAAGYTNASANGYTNDGTTNTVKVNIPPTNLSKLFQTKPGYAEVIITYKQPRIFSAVLGSGAFTITARAVARGIKGGTTPYTTSSIVALDSSKSGALSVTGGVNLSADSPMQVDSSNAAAFVLNGGVNMSAPSIQVTGNYSKGGGSNLTGTVQTGMTPVADPLASLPVPNSASMLPGVGPLAGSYSPGVYNGGLTIGGGANVTLQPGFYYIKGGNFTIANGANMSGSGVTIYIESGYSFNFQGGTNVSLTPPTSGQWAGLSLYEDRNSTSTINLGNGANVNIEGTIYAAKAALNIQGGSNVHAGSQAIVDSFSIANGVNLAFTTASDAKKGYVASKSGGSSSVSVVE